MQTQFFGCAGRMLRISFQHAFAFFLPLLILSSQVLSAFGQGNGAAYVHVAAGSDFTFAIQANGVLWGWGNNFNGQLGDGTTTTRLQPVAIAEPTGAAVGSRWVRIFAPHGSAFSTSVFGLRSDNTLWHWGAGQNRPQPTALAASLPSGATITDLAISQEHFLALYSDGSLLSWGSNSRGQLGIGATAGTGIISTPTPVVTPSQATAGTYWTAIEARDNQSFAVRSDGTLWSWGGVPVTNPSTLGHPVNAGGCFTPEIVPHPSAASPGSGWVSVAAGETHTLGLRSDGTLWVWGYSNYGALGLGTSVTSTALPLSISLPTSAPTGARWARIQAAGNISQGILSDGSLWIWGYNIYGQLGVNSSNPLEAFPQQEYNQEIWTQSTLGTYHAVALSRGRVYVTGNNSTGQLGLGGAITQLPFFVRVIGLPLSGRQTLLFASTNSAWPNPITPGQVLTLPAARSNSQAEFFNAQGKLVAVRQIFQTQVAIPALPPGLYLLRLSDQGTFLATYKVLVN